MRPLPILAAALAAAAFARERAGAQSARASVEVAATVVETPRVQLDAAGATVAATPGAVRLAAPLRVSGAGSPTVAVAGDGVERECQAVLSAPGRAGGDPGAAWLRCSVPRRAAPSGEVTQIRVTLVIAPAT